MKTLDSFRAIAIALLFAGGTARLTGTAADPVVTWNEALTRFSAATRTVISPLVEARAFAITHLAMEQALLAMARDARPIGSDDALERVAVASAARDVLATLLPAEAPRFNAIAAGEFAQAGEGPEKNRAIEVGRAAAALTLRTREGDGWPEPGSDVLAEPRMAAPAVSWFSNLRPEPKSPWLTTRPFLLKSAAQFSVRPPFWQDFDGELQPDYFITQTKLFDAVDRTAPDALLQFWSGSPVVAWNRIARAVVDRARLPRHERARVLALVNVAIADATVSALHWRFMLGQWRARWETAWVPAEDTATISDVTAMLEGTGATLRMRAEPRKILSRPLPEYPSVAATVAGAAGAVLGSIPGEGRAGLAFVVHEEWTPPWATRSYASPTAAARECAFTASLDGRHCREACVAGYHLGEAIGNYAAKQTRARRR